MSQSVETVPSYIKIRCINFICSNLPKDLRPEKFKQISTESITSLNLASLIKSPDVTIKKTVSVFCDMLLTHQAKLTIFDLFGPDLEARDILEKLKWTKLGARIGELDAKCVKGLTHLKKEMVTLIERIKVQE